jgi:hypothetical protein
MCICYCYLNFSIWTEITTSQTRASSQQTFTEGTQITTSQTRASSQQTLTEGTQMAVQEKKDSNELIIGTSAGGGVLILILVIVGICLLKRRYKKMHKTSLLLNHYSYELFSENIFTLIRNT